MAIDEALHRAASWMRGYNELMNGVTFETSARTRVGVALLHLACEHQMGLHTLADHNLYGSALALLRPEIEACVRGVWYLHCATDDQVTKFINGKQPPRVAELLRQVDALPGHNSGVLSKIKNGSWGRLNDYTHGGIVQVKGRVQAAEVSNNIDPNYIAIVLDASVVLACIASKNMAGCTDKAEVATDLQELFDELFPKPA